jgi:inhibitor of KinA sporulation pathway (predicted exonuclease)
LELMVDLETLGTSSDCVVVSIGACIFDLKTNQVISTFYSPLTLQDQLDKGRKIDADTLAWWMKQSDDARRVFQDGAVMTSEGLNTFANWIASNIPDKKRVRAWGNGSNFDISIMEHLYKDYEQPVPWEYYNVMDLRTFRRFVANNAKVEKSGVDHNALDDALSQAHFVIKYSKKVDG